MMTAEKRQYHIRPATKEDETVVESVFARAARQFGLVDTKLA